MGSRLAWWGEGAAGARDSPVVELEQPFEMHNNCLPLDSFCNTIEINLRESVEDSRVVEPLRPVDFLIT